MMPLCRSLIACTHGPWGVLREGSGPTFHATGGAAQTERWTESRAISPGFVTLLLRRLGW